MAIIPLTKSAKAEIRRESPVGEIDRLTIFAFLWSCQALVHQEFFSNWLSANNPLGWLVTIFALATLLRPSSLRFFAALLVSSIAYNFEKWPFVVNHIFLESLINFTILAAILDAWFARNRNPKPVGTFREQIYARFAPVVWVSLVVMYLFAFLAKLNWDFLNPDVSCVVAMYGDLLQRFPFLPTSRAAHVMVIALTIVIEALIPLLLAIPRTRRLGVLVGLPFHLILGLVGHRTFSALAFALYGLCCMNGLVVLANRVKKRMSQQIKGRAASMVAIALAVLTAAFVAALIISNLAGAYRSKIAGLGIYQIPWLVWISWSLAIALCYGLAIVCLTRGNCDAKPISSIAKPGVLWGMVGLVVLNGLSQYLGYKTETCFTMYSNLRTEGPWNNHLFMPALRLASYQDDLVQVTETDHPELESYVNHKEYITSFELRRIVSRTDADFHLTYFQDGKMHEYSQWRGNRKATQSLAGHSFLLEKLLYFRPVSPEECAPCGH